jgi:AmpD protein
MKQDLQQDDYDPATGLVSYARQLSSPNFDARPDNTDIEVLIIHAISLPPRKYGGNYVEHFFCNRLEIDADPYFAEIADIKVSSHFFIPRSGELIQFVPVHQRAWHAGVSCCMGREAVNDFSIGIELEGQDEESYTDAQYEVLAEVLKLLIDTYPGLSANSLAGHCDISPQRKTDPGPAFDWQRLRQHLARS